MALLAPLTNILCRHEYYWSERHLADRCRRCGLLRESDEGGVAAHNDQEADPEPHVEGLDPFERLGAVDWRRPRLSISTDAEAGSVVSAVELRQQTEARRKALPKLVHAAAMGENLTQHEVLDLIMGLIEDGHSSEPQVFGVGAAEQFALLNEARHKG